MNMPKIGTTMLAGPSDAGRLDADIVVGESGTGTLSITGGGVVSSGRFVMADNAGSNGTATVSGAGSMWNNLVVCFVGFLGNAKLEISDGGQVSMSTVSIGESGGSTGLVNVDGAGSTLTHFTGITVGGDGKGTMNITNGGSVVGIDPDFGGGTIGRNPGSNGTVNVNGAGSTWINAGALAVADGFAGTVGTLHISNGAAVSNSYAIVGGAEGIGSVTVDGAGSTWTSSGNLFIGTDAGVGALSITHGGEVSNNNGHIGFGGFEAGKSVGTVVASCCGARHLISRKSPLPSSNH
jgi:T5SS/PEP-CTERM-associated repeat protein